VVSLPADLVVLSASTQAPERDVAADLSAVPRLLRGDPVVATLMGERDTTLAVPEAAQAVVVAALATFSERQPILVVTSAGLDAERLAGDLGCLLPRATPDDPGRDDVVGALHSPAVVLPAWETLPFERVSPEVETMGRRLAVLHSLIGGSAQEELPAAPRVIVAPVRALLQRLGPLHDTAPILIRPGQQVEVADLLPRLVAKGYRREHQVEHRGEFAVRGGIVDVFPSTADTPVRIDLWGDEVDRLTAFAVSDQRSSRDLSCAALFGCRELVPTEEVRRAAEAQLGRRPWGAAIWDRLARGEQFDGMESWLPFLHTEERVVPDLLPAGGQVMLVEPRRIRDRGVQLLDEEASLADTLASTWGAGHSDDHPFPRLHVPFERLLRDCPSGVVAMPPVPEGPSTPALTVRAFEPVAGDPSRLAQGVTRLVGQGFSVTLCAATPHGADRLSATLADEGVQAPVLPVVPGVPGPCVVAAPIQTGFVGAASRIARPVPGREPPTRSSTTSKWATSSSTASTE